MSVEDMLPEFVTSSSNTSCRIPVALCLDVSQSMHGQPMEELNHGLKVFVQGLIANSTLHRSVLLGMIPFAGNAIQLRPFELLSSDTGIPRLEVLLNNRLHAGTNIDQGVRMSVRGLRACIEQHKREGVSLYRPWLILMSDGRSGVQTGRELAAKVCGFQKEGLLNVIALGIGPHARLETLSAYSTQAVRRVKDFQFSSIFQAMISVFYSVSQSRPGEQCMLPDDAVRLLDKATASEDIEPVDQKPNWSQYKFFP